MSEVYFIAHRSDLPQNHRLILYFLLEIYFVYSTFCGILLIQREYYILQFGYICRLQIICIKVKLNL